MRSRIVHLELVGDEVDSHAFADRSEANRKHYAGPLRSKPRRRSTRSAAPMCRWESPRAQSPLDLVGCDAGRDSIGRRRSRALRRCRSRASVSIRFQVGGEDVVADHGALLVDQDHHR